MAIVNGGDYIITGSVRGVQKVGRRSNRCRRRILLLLRAGIFSLHVKTVPQRHQLRAEAT